MTELLGRFHRSMARGRVIERITLEFFLSLHSSANFRIDGSLTLIRYRDIVVANGDESIPTAARLRKIPGVLVQRLLISN